MPVHNTSMASPDEPYLGKYDEDLIMMVSDHYHTDSGSLVAWYLNTESEGVEPVPDNGLINGRNSFDCSRASDALFPPPTTKTTRGGFRCNSNAPRSVFDIERGLTYRIRIINTGSFADFKLSIDQHELTVIEADGIDMQPVTVQRVPIHVAQRYSVLLVASQTISNATDTVVGNSFWIRAEMNTNCFNIENPALDPSVKATLRYREPLSQSINSRVGEMGSQQTIANSVDWETSAWSPHCDDLKAEMLKPLLARDAPEADIQIVLEMSFQTITENRVNMGYVNRTSWRPLSQNPTLFQVASGGDGGEQSSLSDATVFDASQLVVTLDRVQTVELVVNKLPVHHPTHPLYHHYRRTMDRTMGLTRVNQDEPQLHLPKRIPSSLEELQMESPVTLSQLAQFFDDFDSRWEERRVKYTSSKTVPEDDSNSSDDEWAEIFSTSSPQFLDMKKQHILGALEPRLVDCNAALMSSVNNLVQLLTCADRSCTTNSWHILLSTTGYLSRCDELIFDIDLSGTSSSSVASPTTTTVASPLSPQESQPRFIVKPSERGSDIKSWPKRGEVVTVNIVSFEELCSLWERVLDRLTAIHQTQADSPLTMEGYGHAIRALQTLQHRWEQMTLDTFSEDDLGDVAMALPPSMGANQILSLLSDLKDVAHAQASLLAVLPHLQGLDRGANLETMLKPQLDHSELGSAVVQDRTSDEVLDQATIPLPESSTFDNTQSTDSHYDPNEWIITPEEASVPGDRMAVTVLESRSRTSSTDTTSENVEMTLSPTPSAVPGQDSTSTTLYSSPVEPPSLTDITLLVPEKISLEEPMAAWLEILREQQEKAQQQMQQQIQELQQQLQLVQLEKDQQQQKLRTLEQRQGPQLQLQMQLGSQVKELVEQNKQFEEQTRAQQVQLADMQEQLLWQQQQLANREEQPPQESSGVQQSDIARLEQQLERLQRQQKQQQRALTPLPAASNSSKGQQQPLPQPPQSPPMNHKKFQQLFTDHQHLESAYQQLKQRFDRQVEKQRRQLDRQDQIEQQITKYQDLFQGHKQGARQTAYQHLQRIVSLEKQLAHLQKSLDAIALQSGVEAPSWLTELTPSEEPAEDALSSQPSFSKRKKETKAQQRARRDRSRTKAKVATSTTSELQIDSIFDSNPAVHHQDPGDAVPVDEGVKEDVVQSISGKDEEVVDPTEESDGREREAEAEAVAAVVRESGSEAEAADEVNFVSISLDGVRHLRRSGRRIGGDGKGEVPEVSSVTDAARSTSSAGQESGDEVESSSSRSMSVTTHDRRSRLRSGRGRQSPEKENEGQADEDEECVADKEEAKEEGVAEVEVREEESEQDKDEDNEDKVEEDKGKVVDVDERAAHIRTSIPNTKVLRSQRKTATATTTTTLSINGTKTVRFSDGNETEAMKDAPAPRQPPSPPQPRVTRSSLNSNPTIANSNSNNGNNSSSNNSNNSSDGKTKSSSNSNSSPNAKGIDEAGSVDDDDDESAKENPRKRAAEEEVLVERRLRSLRSAGPAFSTVRKTRSRGSVGNFHEMLGPSAPKILRI
ncbi:hypothetical protein BGX29_006355 [Mortierella sp. GBA35]|nr:hypothetical protein BGX29_006355 [Mortierella sp. GBA35]